MTIMNPIEVALMSMQRFNLIPLQEAIDLLGVSRSTFDRWRKLKQLPFVKIGKEILIDKKELEQWVRLHAVSLQNPVFTAGASSTVSPQEYPTLTVGYQSGTAHMWTSLIMKELGWLEEELAAANPSRVVQVKWFDGANGAVLLQGMIGGSIQIASLGDYPIVLGASLRQTFPAFNPVLIAFDGKTSGGQGISLILRKGLEPSDISEICGWSLTSAAQSSAGRRLSKLLQSLGGNQDQVIHKEMDESMAGIVKRKIAGCAMWEPYISLVNYHGVGSVLFQEGIGEDYLTGVVADERWVHQHEGDAIAYLKAHLRVHAFVRNDPEAAAELISRIKGIPVEIAVAIMTKVRWDASFYTKDMNSLTQLYQENDADHTATLSRLQNIRWNGDYLQQAIKALKLPHLSRQPLEGDWSAEQLY
ncbi:helix-turn-helix domain-containing protein [Paenibacillus sp. LMG 31461]|uniref:Helix-turn-helix domain-containing protein n=1 Tax=Paenibacillus plantarum TaxID=2654975 RepID=A0ABX1XE20_9BACL|nr:helix-turn-helix domain-containing protein [Paenibacillus plantarum]NOU66641.1 helix-turn-helix domain-containing protein [Paenibacillus plantarum]